MCPALLCMYRGKLRHNRDCGFAADGSRAIYKTSAECEAKPLAAAAKPNRMRKRYVQALYLSAGFSDFQKEGNGVSNTFNPLSKSLYSFGAIAIWVKYV